MRDYASNANTQSIESAQRNPSGRHLPRHLLPQAFLALRVLAAAARRPAKHAQEAMARHGEAVRLAVRHMPATRGVRWFAKHATQKQVTKDDKERGEAMQDNNDGGHRTPLRWPPRVGRRQWKPRAGGPSHDQPGSSHGDGSHGGAHHGPPRPADEPPLRDGSRDAGSRDTSAGVTDRTPEAREPHERDESVDKVGVPEVRTKQRKTIQRAYEDVTSGRVDTEVRGNMHETYGRLRRKPTPPR